MSILQNLAEGKLTTSLPVTIDSAIETFINESSMPMDILIESAYINIQTELNRAYEVYEMASIIGTAQVLQEGTNVQEAAAAVMEGNIKDFFGKILEQLKKIRDWFIGIIKKIFGKLTGKDNAVENASISINDAKKAMAQNPGRYKLTFEGYLYNPDGKKLYDNILSELDKKLDLCGNELTKAEQIVASGNYDEAVSKKGPMLVFSSKDGVAHEIGKSVGITASTTHELAEAIIKGFGVDPDKKTECDITTSFVARLSKDLTDMTDIVIEKEKRISTVTKKVNDLVKRMEKIKNITEKGAINSSSSKMLLMDCTSIVEYAQNILQVELDVVNWAVQAILKLSKENQKVADIIKKTSNDDIASMDSFDITQSYLGNFLV